jgi:hypothetical protein
MSNKIEKTKSNKIEGVLTIIGGIGYGIYTLYNRTTSSDYALSLLMSGERGASVFAKAESYGATQDKFFYFNIAISIALIISGIYLFIYKKDYYCPHCKSKIQKDASKCLHCTSDLNIKNQKSSYDSINNKYENEIFAKYDNSKVSDVSKFKGDKELSNDAYKLYLVNKYKVTKNDVFNKFVYLEKMYESIDELLAILDSEEKILYSAPKVISEFRNSSEEYLVTATKNKLSQLGYVITETNGANGNRKFTLKKGAKSEYFYSAKELIDYSNTFI